MDHPDRDVQPMHDVTAQLEQAFIDEFIRLSGHDPTRLHELPPEERDELLKRASQHAGVKLAEVEARAHYVHELHGDH